MQIHLNLPTAVQRQRKVRVRKKRDVFEIRDQLNQFAERWAPNFYIAQREGQVLSRGMLLKYDRFPSSKIVRTDVSISGGPNYRKIDESLPLCAVGQPSIHGIRTILNLLIGSPHFIKMQKQLNDLSTSATPIEQSDLLNELHNLEDAMILMPQNSFIAQSSSNVKKGQCIWLNLREEPVIYINNRPFVLRDADHPFRNIQSFKGITWQHLRELEQRLKRDILIEASQHHNILIHKEDAEKQVVPCWEAITHQTVQTSEETFKGLISEGYDVKYYRVPLTPESDLLCHTIDHIFKICIKHSLSSETMPYFTVNCQMGRGRSTLVTILIYLIFKKLGIVDAVYREKRIRTGRRKHFSVAASPSPTSVKTFRFSPSNSYSKMPRLPFSAIKKSQSNPHLNAHTHAHTHNVHAHQEEYRQSMNEHGDYEVINRILRVLSNGKSAKADVDEAIAACGDLYNMRHEMARCRLLLENAENDDEKELITYSTKNILSKYCTLIAFAAFLHCIKIEDLGNLDVRFDFKINSFSRFMTNFPSLQKITADIFGLSYDDLMEKYRSKMPKSMNGMLILNRIGSVLSANTILKSDIMKQKTRRRNLKLNEQLHKIKFRFLSDVGIATCSQPPSNIIESILRNKLNKMKKIWIDLREEPILYIRSRPYVARNYDRPYQRLPEFDNLLTAQQIDDIAQRLKQDIHQEAEDNDNKMLVHFESESHELKEATLPIDMTNPTEIQTTKQIFDALSDRGYLISYQKLPFNPKNTMQFEQIERLGKVIQSHIEADSTIIFSCRQGIHRSSVAAILSILIAYHHGSLAYVDENDESSSPLILKHKGTSSLTPRRKKKDTQNEISPKMPQVSPPNTASQEPSELSLPTNTENIENTNNNKDKEPHADSTDDDDEPQQDAECHAVISLMRILRKGLVMKRQVDAAIEHCSEYYHIKQAIYESRGRWENARTAEESQAYLQKTMRHLRIYTNLICFNAYLYEYYYAKKYNDLISIKYKLLSFSEWMKSRGELKLWLNKMVQKPQLALSMSDHECDAYDADDDEEKHVFAQVFEQRTKKSSVLSGNSLLKVDYFPGCAQLQPNMDAESAINFRYIDAVGVAGVAIPTTDAMQEVVLFCAQKWKDKQTPKRLSRAAPILWICLREEPVLYVNDEPVVLREVHQPYENLIFTGITTRRVQAMEKTLKNDAQKECEKFENKLLIHCESDTGNLEAEWQEIDVDDNKIMTCHEAYCCAFDSIDSSINIDAHYHRLPITDEQAPPAAIIDTFISLFEANPADSIFIFNCQMGRGRTTTGMVIYALWKRRVKLCQIPHSMTPKKKDENNSKQALLNGEYNAVLTLLRMLPQGKQAKKWCDDVVDILSHMQNLRKAIYQMQLRSAKAVSEKSKELLAHRTQNYLQRYCLLIAFASYLLNDYQEPDPVDRNDDHNEENEDEDDDDDIIDMGATFQEWLDERAAVRNCIYSASLDD